MVAENIIADEEGLQFATAQFPQLDESAARRLLATARWETFDAGVRLTAIGEPLEDLIYLAEGTIFRTATDGFFHSYTDGAFVCAVACLADAPAPWNCVVMRRSRCLCFDADRLRILVANDPKIRAAFRDRFADERAGAIIEADNVH